MKPTHGRYFGYVLLSSLGMSLLLTMIEHFIHGKWVITLIYATIAVLLSVLVSWFLAKKIEKLVFEPIRETTVVAKKLAASDLEHVIHYKGGDEIDQLQDVLTHVGSRLKDNLREIATERNKFDAILRSMADGVVMLDNRGRVVLVNPAAQKLFFIPHHSIPNKPLLEVIRNHQLAEMLKTSLDTNESLSQTIELQNPIPRTVKVNTTIVKTARGDTYGAVAVFHDITEIANLQKMRSEFVANVSHELRTPLTSIKGFVETLLDGVLEDTEMSKRFLAIINSETVRLERLIEDILSLSQIEANKESLALSQVNLPTLIYEALDILKLPLEKKGLALNNDIAANIPFIKADYNKIEQVLINLLDNAIKYTPTGGTIKVSAWTEEKGEQASIIVQITDTGIGIPLESQARIFERFYRVDEARSRSMGGTGLGLAIVKKIVEMHDGTIFVQSAIGSGSSFTMMLPVK